MKIFEEKFMRVLLMFDVPTLTKKDRKNAAKFRSELIKQGFFMMQFSVYMRICKGAASARSAVERVREILPPAGNIRALVITEKQFDNMQILLGVVGFNERMNSEKSLALFEFDEKIGDWRYWNDDVREADSERDSDLERDSGRESSERDSVSDSLGRESGRDSKPKIDKPKHSGSLFEF